jgi:hypothetical protein
MAELTFLGLSQDGTTLLLADSRGRKHSLSIDARLTAALRLDGPPTGQREMTLNAIFSPREIQARLRAGASVSDLADEYGVDIERIDRFAGPPLADRAYAADQARNTSLASHLGERSLAITVATAAEASGVGSDTIRWDAWIREDGRWQVLSAYPAGRLDYVATWLFDPHSHVIEAADESARAIVDGPRAAVALSVVDDKPRPTRRKRPAAAESQSAPTDDDTRSTAVETHSAADPDSSSAAGDTESIASESSAAPPAPEQAQTGAAEPEAAQPDAARTEAAQTGAAHTDAAHTDAPPPSRSSRRGKRASVPSWDEILFGSTVGDGGREEADDQS